MTAASTFTGFPREGLKFMAQLAENNNRDWFNAHKEVYTQQVLAPAQAFVVALGQRLQTISKKIQFDPQASGRGSIMRIYRDLRFSKDKTPYNTHVGLVFWEGALKKTENPAFYVGIEADGAQVYAGMHMFPKPLLEPYRKAVADKKRGAELEKALAEARRAGKYEIGAEGYKRVPAGYPADHPRADLLRYGGLHALAPKIGRGVVTSAKLVEACFEHCRNLAPLHRWLVRLSEG